MAPGGSVLADGLMWADVCLVWPVGADLLGQRESLVDLFAEQSFVFHRPEAPFE